MHRFFLHTVAAVFDDILLVFTGFVRFRMLVPSSMFRELWIVHPYYLQPM